MNLFNLDESHGSLSSPYPSEWGEGARLSLSVPMLVTIFDIFGGKVFIICLLILSLRIYPFPLVVTAICRPDPLGSI